MWDSFAHLRRCAGAPLRLCAFAPVRLCACAHLRLCAFAPVRLCAFAHLRRCACAPVRLCASAPTRKKKKTLKSSLFGSKKYENEAIFFIWTRTTRFFATRRAEMAKNGLKPGLVDGGWMVGRGYFTPGGGFLITGAG